MHFPTPVPTIKQQNKANTTCDLTFDPPRCSLLFHDSVQTPGFPHGDGDCAAPGCDVGKKLPIGAYLFNPAAANTSVNGQTFTEWFIDDYLFGPYGGSNPNISGFFFDDQFNPSGATESMGTLKNLGLSKAEGAKVSEAYWAYMNTVYASLLKRGKFAWQLLWTGQPDCAYKYSYGCLGTTGTNLLVTQKNCATSIRKFCTAGNIYMGLLGVAMLGCHAPSTTRYNGMPEYPRSSMLLYTLPLPHVLMVCLNSSLYPQARSRSGGR